VFCIFGYTTRILYGIQATDKEQVESERDKEVVPAIAGFLNGRLAQSICQLSEEINCFETTTPTKIIKLITRFKKIMITALFFKKWCYFGFWFGKNVKNFNSNCCLYI
jgi:hypothetical protein